MAQANLTLALDAMGGDLGPSIVVAALARALQEFPQVKFVIVGDLAILSPLLQNHQLAQHPRVTAQHASEVVEMTDKPGTALRVKPDSSMRVGLELVQQGTAQALISSGNTGALMSTAYFTLKTLPGVLRPALISVIPHVHGGHTWLLDLGANAVCDADTLFQFGVMGSVQAQLQLGRQPRVALLNMGAEDTKGSDAVKGAAAQLSASPHIHYVGFIEGDDLFADKADVIVCDGFVGNVALKACEGLADLLLAQIKASVKQHWASRLFAKLFYKRLLKSWDWLKPDHYNGASLIGLRGVVIKSHGDANEQAFCSAIRQAVAAVEYALPEQIQDKVEAVLLEST